MAVKFIYTKCLVTSILFGLVGCLSHFNDKVIEAYGMLMVSFTSVLNHGTGSRGKLMLLDRVSNLVIGAYMMVYRFRFYFLLLGSIPLLIFLHRVWTEIPGKRGSIDQNFHLFAVHIPILMGFLMIAFEDMLFLLLF